MTSFGVLYWAAVVPTNSFKAENPPLHESSHHPTITVEIIPVKGVRPITE